MKINLIPEVKQEQIKVQKTNAIVTLVSAIVGFIVVGVIIVVSIFIFGRSAQISSDNAAITKLKATLKTQEEFEKTVMNVQQGIEDVKGILGDKNTLKLVFTEIEKATPGDIRFRSLNISEEGKTTADIEGTNVASIDRFIKSFSNYKVKDKNIFTDVSVNGYTVNDINRVIFSATFNINESNL